MEYTKDEIQEKYDTLLKEYQKLSQMYNILDMVIENSADAIWIFDADGICIRVNKSYETLSGMSRDELVGRPARDLIGTKVSDATTDRVIKTGKPVTIEQTFLLTGKKVIVTGVPVFDADGNLVMGICNDRNMDELEKLRNELREAQDLSLKYEMQTELLISNFYGKSELIAKDEKMLEFLRQSVKVAKLDSTVLITGETGVGKEEVAKLIHENSSRTKEAYVKINCGAIAPELIESEFFGYEKGAFTSANTKGKMGMFELADGGTLFLDEIGELPLQMQVKLLRVLQEQEIRRVGGTKEIKVNVRIIAATNRDLEEMVQRKLFREDLYYRINVFPLHVPPLRERKHDVQPLAEVFLQRLNEKYNYHKKYAKDVLPQFCQYEWLGNVRELKNCIEQAFIRSEDNYIRKKDLPIIPKQADTVKKYQKQSSETLDDFLKRIEYDYILEAYEQGKNVRNAAGILQMSPATFVRKRAKLMCTAEHDR